MSRRYGRLRPSKVYFKIYQKETLILSTKQTLLWNLAEEDLIGIEITVTIAKPEGLNYSVSGTIRLADGTPFAGAKVVAFDKDIRRKEKEVMLGEGTSDESGRYKIVYSHDLFQSLPRMHRVELTKERPDLVLKVYKQEDSKPLVISKINYNVTREKILDITIPATAHPVQSAESSETALLRLRLLAESQMLTQPASYRASPGAAPLEEIIDTSRIPVSNEQKAKFMNIYLQYKGGVEEFWQSLRGVPEFQAGGLIDELRITVQVGNLTQNHLQLVRKLQDKRLNGEFRTLRDLVKLTEEDWFSLITDPPDGEEIIGAPSTISGDTDEERARNYAQSLTRKLEEILKRL